MNWTLESQSYKNSDAIENSLGDLDEFCCVTKAGFIRTLCVFLFFVGADAFSQSSPKNLFNGKDLAAWDTWLGPKFDTVTGAQGKVSTGLNTDPSGVFSVVTEDGQPAIRVSGEHFGGISTREEFSDYHLRIEFKWGTAKWAPRKANKRDSGILYHAVGAHGADFGYWMRSQEFQVQEGDCGDYWGVAGGSFDVPARVEEQKRYVFDPRGKVFTFNEKSANGRQCIRSVDAEKPNGNWNVVEIYCVNDTAVHIMNGKVVMILYKSAQLDNGKLSPLTRGKIQIQSEGAEVFYRNVAIRPVKQIPESILNHVN